MRNLWAYGATVSLIGTVYLMTIVARPEDSLWAALGAGLLATCTIRFTITAVYAEVDIRLNRIKAKR